MMKIVMPYIAKQNKLNVKKHVKMDSIEVSKTPGKIVTMQI